VSPCIRDPAFIGGRQVFETQCLLEVLTLFWRWELFKDRWNLVKWLF